MRADSDAQIPQRTDVIAEEAHIGDTGIHSVDTHDMFITLSDTSINKKLPLSRVVGVPSFSYTHNLVFLCMH